MKPYTYLLIDLACISVPFIASFYKPRPFFKYWKQFAIACLTVGIPFLIWDVIFTEKGIWGFNPDYLTGINIYNLPIEEVLFFLCIPYACTFTFFALQLLLPKDPLANINPYLKWVFLAISIFFIIAGYDQAYTFWTGLFTTIFMLITIVNRTDLSHVFLAYFAILPFFFMSNGLLTGSLVDAPIVWYNDTENFAKRMLTIPVEDSIYGFLLVAGNMVIFNQLAKTKLNTNEQ